jgi:hypothetical protein
LPIDQKKKFKKLPPKAVNPKAVNPAGLTAGLVGVNPVDLVDSVAWIQTNKYVFNQEAPTTIV